MLGFASPTARCVRAGALLALATTTALAAACPKATAAPPAKKVDPCVKQVSDNGRDARGIAPTSPNPLTGLSFYVDPSEPAAVDHRSYQATGQTAKAGQIAKLARAPKFRWFGRWSSMKQVAAYIEAARCAGKVPQMVTLRHQGKECGPGYQGGGPAEDRLSEAWFRDFARTVGDARVVIAYEPDSIGTIDCLTPARRAARQRLLRYGVDVLSRLPNATIYLEATASDWKSATFTARMLRLLGIEKVRGFMLNATHYDWTSSNISYGQAVSRLVGGKPFVVNTSHNGRGPVHYKDARTKRTVNVYCNPQMRGLGPNPTTTTRQRRVDAFLYINRPGYSGGACNGAPAKVGTWWPERALAMGRYATEWVEPPGIHFHGLSRPVSLCRLGAPVRGLKRYSTVDPARRC